MNCAQARAALEDIRKNRRSQSPSDLAGAARALDFDIDKTISKNSYWWARKPGRRFSIPTNNNPVPVGTTTTILRILEAEFEDECSEDADRGPTQPTRRRSRPRHTTRTHHRS